MRALFTVLAVLSALKVAAAPGELRFLTTTSTENSGLIAAVMPLFERETGIKVYTITVGTGRALQMGRNGDGDVLLVHAREAELRFVAEGHGLHRREVMYNDFILVGPPDDPAGVSGGGGGEGGVLEVFRALAAHGALFVSRGDDSGTHQRELSLWRAAGVDTGAAPWRRETGQGMGRTLLIASELVAYVLVDRGTWLSYRGRLALALLHEGGERLANVYGVMAVNPAGKAGVNYDDAQRLVEWFASRRAQQAIGAFRVGGEKLFHPLVYPQ